MDDCPQGGVKVADLAHYPHRLVVAQGGIEELDHLTRASAAARSQAARTAAQDTATSGVASTVGDSSAATAPGD